MKLKSFFPYELSVQRYLNERVFLRLAIVSEEGLYAIVPYRDRADTGIGVDIYSYFHNRMQEHTDGSDRPVGSTGCFTGTVSADS